jgi:cytoskeletal protein RodZ
MKAEKVILSFVAVFVGLVAAGIAFYFYQSTKVIPTDQTKPSATQVAMQPTKAPNNSDVFTIDSPGDEQVYSQKSITIKGTAVKGATITVSTDDEDQVVQPADNGDFTLTQTIPNGTSLIEFTTIFPDGTVKKIDRTVTFSTENF